MDSSVVQRNIKELEKVRAMTRWIRLACSLATLGIAATCVAMILSAVRGLSQPGPTQDEFSHQLTTNLQRDVVPRVQTIASQTLTELRPQVEDGFRKLNARAPEISGAAMQEFETLNKNVSTKGEGILEKTFGAMLAKKEAKVRAMFPGTSDTQIKAMLTSVSNEAQTRILDSHDQLLSPHMNQLQGIVGNLSVIQAQEKINPQSQNTDTELVSTVIDLLHSDMNAVPNASGASSSSAPSHGNKSMTHGAAGHAATGHAGTYHSTTQHAATTSTSKGAAHGTAPRGY